MSITIIRSKTIENQRRSKLRSQRGKENAKNCAQSQYLTFNRYRLLARHIE